MISRIKKSIFDTTFCRKKKESEEFVTKEGDIFLYDDEFGVFFFVLLKVVVCVEENKQHL